MCASLALQLGKRGAGVREFLPQCEHLFHGPWGPSEELDASGKAVVVEVCMRATCRWLIATCEEELASVSAHCLKHPQAVPGSRLFDVDQTLVDQAVDQGETIDLAEHRVCYGLGSVEVGAADEDSEAAEEASFVIAQ
jgi:hypothetical protein